MRTDVHPRSDEKAGLERHHSNHKTEVDTSIKPIAGGPRSDSEIARAVDTAFHWHDSMPANRIKVHVKEGWVTLNGEVDWEYQRAAAVNLAQTLAGVVGISNCIMLNPAHSRRTSEKAPATRPAAGPEAGQEPLHEQLRRL